MQVRLVEGAYVQLEDAYCLRSVEEAMRIAEPIEVQYRTGRYGTMGMIMIMIRDGTVPFSSNLRYRTVPYGTVS